MLTRKMKKTWKRSHAASNGGIKEAKRVLKALADEQRYGAHAVAASLLRRYVNG